MNLNDDSLRSLVRRVQQQTGEANPHRIAEKILADLPDVMLRPALEVTLAAYVRNVVARPTIVEPPTGVGRSRRAVVRSRVAAWLATPTYGDGEWKPLGDFTLADCEAAAQERRQQAQENLARAAWFERLGGLLAETKAARVADLPDDKLAEVAP